MVSYDFDESSNLHKYMTLRHQDKIFDEGDGRTDRRTDGFLPQVPYGGKIPRFARRIFLINCEHDVVMGFGKVDRNDQY